MTALAIREEQTLFDDFQMAVLRQGGVEEDVTNAELAAFLHVCQRRRLDPFTGQIYLIGRWDRQKGRKVYKPQTSIDGFRLIARRAADVSKIDYEYEDTIWFDAKGRKHEVWLGNEPPAAAKVVVVRNGRRFDGVARYSAYVATNAEGKPTGQWRGMSDHMIAKCAEALALRKAFPEDLGGIYVDEEMEQADNPPVDPDKVVQATAERADRGAVTTDEAWFTDIKDRVEKLRSHEEGQQLWREINEARDQRRCAPDDVKDLREYIAMRVESIEMQAAASQDTPGAQEAAGEPQPEAEQEGTAA